MHRLAILTLVAIALIAFATGTVNAQERAVLQKMEAPGAGFNVLIADSTVPSTAPYGTVAYSSPSGTGYICPQI